MPLCRGCELQSSPAQTWTKSSSGGTWSTYQTGRCFSSALKPGGKYEMATVELRENEEVSAPVVRRLVKAAVGFNDTLGNPTDI